MTPPKESTPKVVKRETIVSESYVEMRKRAVANNKSVDSAIKSQKLPPPVIKPSAVKHVDGSQWEWKAVLVVLALITTILLVYYIMEGSPDTPQLKSNV